jgi:hypothetical protein
MEQMEQIEQEEQTSHLVETRPDIATRWKKGQSGNPKGRRPALGNTLTWYARLLLEWPVKRSDGDVPRERMFEYMLDIVQRADAGDLKCRMFLLRLVDRGDRRKVTALRNSRKAKTASLRKFEDQLADEISQVPPPPPPELAAKLTATVSPTAPERVQTRAAAKRAPSTCSASSFRSDPRSGELYGSDGRALSREEEDLLRYPNWPHMSPHLKKEETAGSAAGLNAGDSTGASAGPKNPAPAHQALDSVENSGTEKIVQKNTPRAAADPTRTPPFDPWASRGRLH